MSKKLYAIRLEEETIEKINRISEKKNKKASRMLRSIIENGLNMVESN